MRSMSLADMFVEAGPLWTRHPAQALTLQRCWSLANAIASYTAQHIDAQSPLLSAQLPGGERIQILVPPAAERDTVSMTIRIPDAATRTFSDYQSQGFFSHYVWARPLHFEARRADLLPVQLRLIEHLEQNRLAGFLALAVFPVLGGF